MNRAAAEKWKVQLRKGCLELAILAALWQGRLYRLEILRLLESNSELMVSEGHDLSAAHSAQGAWIGRERTEDRRIPVRSAAMWLPTPAIVSETCSCRVRVSEGGAVASNSGKLTSLLGLTRVEVDLSKANPTSGGVTASTEMLAAKRHAGVHTPVIACKTIIANQQMAYAA